MSSPFSNLSRDPEQIERQIDQWAQGFAAKAERYKAAQEQVEQVRSSATSSDGGVRVTVRSDGSVTDLEFTERVRTLPLPELSSQILATMRQAQANVVNQVGDVMTDQLGDEDVQTRTALLDDLRTRFPEPEDETEEPDPVSEKWDYDKEETAPPAPPPAPPAPPAATPPPPAPRRRPRDDEDFDPDFDPLRD